MPRQLPLSKLLLRQLGAAKRFLRRQMGFPAPTVAASTELQSLVASLGPQDIAIDCGANVGEVTEVLAWNGATVHAFEPNPYAFDLLRRRFRYRSNVICHQAAVGVKAGTLPLYLHVNGVSDQVYWSTASSLLQVKSNVDPNRSVSVDVIDLGEFLSSLPHQAALMKLDVEGVEVEILDHLIDTGAIRQADRILVERHDHKIPELEAPMRALLDKLKQEGITHVRLDWH
jgi:FkbM family methyltransferase